MFDFLKKKDSGVPDIGKEFLDAPVSNTEDSSAEENNADNYIEEKEPEEEIKEKKSKKKSQKSSSGIIKDKNTIYDTEDYKIEKITAKLEANNELIKGYSERLSQISEQVGEVRAMALNNEKDLSAAFAKSAKVIDVVSEVKPEHLRLDYQKANMRIEELSERIEAYKQFTETIMNELKDLRNKAGIFVGTDALLRLNEDVKKDLIEIQKTSVRVRSNAEKSEDIFIELKKTLAESQKISSIIASLDSSYSGLKKDVDKLRLDYLHIVKPNELDDFKKSIGNKIIALESSASQVASLKMEYEKLSSLVEIMVDLEKKNKSDIEDLTLAIGDEKLEKVAEYEKNLASLLTVTDNLADQINMLKSKFRIPGKVAKPSKHIEKIKKETKTAKIVKAAHKIKSEKRMSKVRKLLKKIKEKRKLEKKLENQKIKGEKMEKLKKEKEEKGAEEKLKKEKAEKEKKEKEKAEKAKLQKEKEEKLKKERLEKQKKEKEEKRKQEIKPETKLKHPLMRKIMEKQKLKKEKKVDIKKLLAEHKKSKHADIRKILAKHEQIKPPINSAKPADSKKEDYAVI